MDMSVLFPTLLILSLLWLYFHSASKKEKLSHSKKSQQQPARAQYHGVTIETCHHACEKVKALESKRFLAREVPPIPVYGCTNRQCSCKYHHHEDRRSGEDRRYPSITMEGVFANTEQRIKHGRRREDFA